MTKSQIKSFSISCEILSHMDKGIAAGKRIERDIDGDAGNSDAMIQVLLCCAVVDVLSLKSCFTFVYLP